MSVDPRLLEVLVCPACKGPLAEVRAAGDGFVPPEREQPLIGLDCRSCRLRFSVADDIPVMLVDQARRIPA